MHFVLPDVIPKNLENACLACFARPTRYRNPRSLVDSSAGHEHHQEQIGLDVEAATGDTSLADLTSVPGEGSSTGNVTGGRKFARHHFLALQPRLIHAQRQEFWGRAGPQDSDQYVVCRPVEVQSGLLEDRKEESGRRNR
jgi:hypothetical protein